ncbi:hypothetical protein AQ925_04150 [Burkholderia pseudomallei]|nr:hypothetical protein WJ84_11805 [Burkholderia ubonensis]ONC96286.1 hypothetical protein AQ926_20980 [Burkholderia pseudomallei]ONC98203.1 hypothetical protein AQ925_04150 [Burkholderia pseudomallei]ONC98956.1 hypothetical protein AQ927_07805 [Burkholderia pseudomallei]OND23418.1 hypothetical protein AQ930_10220 [Burkholderia pseudomallei]
MAYLDQGHKLEEFHIPNAAPITRPSYRDPEDPSNTWSGFGRRPSWLLKYLKAGRKLEEFEVTDEKKG